MSLTRQPNTPILPQIRDLESQHGDPDKDQSCTHVLKVICIWCVEHYS